MRERLEQQVTTTFVMREEIWAPAWLERLELNPSEGLETTT